MKSKNIPPPLIPIQKSETNSLRIAYSFHSTCYGSTLTASTNKGLCYLAFGDKERMLNELKARFPKATIHEQLQPIHDAAASFISGKYDKEIVLNVYGTAFQQAVWNELLKIPDGETTTYQAIATTLNNPKAVRAVGTAVGQNPVSYLIPCHRVVRTDGGLGGYHWGIEIKKQILDNEK